MKKILAIVAMLFAVNAFAISSDSVSGAGFDKLTESQKAQILGMVAKTAEGNVSGNGTVGSITPENAEKWMNVGARIGAGLAGAARETGVAVNEFAKTPVGMMTMAIIAWSYIGGALVHVGGGALILIVGLSMILYVCRCQFPMEYKYDPERKDTFGRPVVISKRRAAMQDGDAAGYLAAVAVIIVVSLVVIFTF